ncbi:MAG: sugar phosphate isomerase/epimerase [Oscillospiraceae bacterium]
MKVGLDVYTIRELGLSPLGALEYAKQHGFDGVQFETITTLCHGGLNRDELRKFKQTADNMGLYTFVSVERINPLLFEHGTRKDLVDELKSQIEFAAFAGWHELRSEMGLLKHRKANPADWGRHLAASESVLRELVPVLKENKSRINIEIHTDSTSFEVLSIVEAIGSDVAGINLDTGNILLHGEFPPEVAKRVAPYTHLVHAKDVLVFEHERGYLRQGCAPGRGMVDFHLMLDELYRYNPNICLSIEDHKNLFTVPVFEHDWYEDHPDASAYEIANILNEAKRTSWRLRNKELQDCDDYEEIPYVEQMEDRLGFGLAYLKELVKNLGYYN